MTEYQNLPNDPAMLLSFVNTQLRDNYPSFSELVIPDFTSLFSCLFPG